MIDNYISTDFITDMKLIGVLTLNEFYLNLRRYAKILTQTDIPNGKSLISIFTFVYNKIGIDEETFYHVVLDGGKVISICNLTNKIQYKQGEQ